MKLEKINTLLMAILFVALAALAIFSYTLSVRQQDYRKDTFITSAQLGYSIEKMGFCLDHTITPCTDEQISARNGANPETIFTLKSHQELVEAGIEDFNLSRR